MVAESGCELDPEAETIRFYTECLEEYFDGCPEGLSPEVGWMLGDVLHHAKRPGLMLDVACGHGRLLGEIPLGGLRYLGVDASAPLIEAGRHLYRDYDHEFRIANILSLSDAVPERADVCVSLFALSHISRPKIDRALREIRTVMKPDAVGLLQFIHGEGEQIASRQDMPHLPPGYRICLTYWTAETLASHLTGAGFEILEAVVDHAGYLDIRVRAV